MFGLGIQEALIIGAVAVMLFGKRLPEVARSLGGTYRDFRRGLTEMQSQMDFSDTTNMNSSSYASNYTAEESEDYDQPTAPRFELPPPAESSSDTAGNPVD